MVSLTTRAKFAKSLEFAQNSWFVGFAPRRNPDIVVGVLFEGGEHGKLAARMAAQVIRSYVERERIKALELKRAAAPGTNPTLGPDRFTPPKQALQKKPENKTVAEKQTASIDFTGVWHEGSADAADEQKLNTGSFRVRVNPAARPPAAKAAPGISP